MYYGSVSSLGKELFNRVNALLKKDTTLKGTFIEELKTKGLCASDIYKDSYLFIHELNGVIVGIVITSDPHKAYVSLDYVWVHPEFRGRGVGSYLLSYIDTHLKKKVLNITTWSTNLAQVHILEKMGFVVWDYKPTGKKDCVLLYFEKFTF